MTEPEQRCGTCKWWEDHPGRPIGKCRWVIDQPHPYPSWAWRPQLMPSDAGHNCDTWEAKPPQARPIQPGDRIRCGGDEVWVAKGVWLGRHRGCDVIWWDGSDRPGAASHRLSGVTHADGTPVEWPEVES